MQTDPQHAPAGEAGQSPIGATDDLLAQVYDELRALAAYHLQRERPGHSLPPTAVVHEVYLRLAAQDRACWSNRAQFLSVASRMIRRVLVDHARGRDTAKRGRGVRVTLNDHDPPGEARDADLIALDEAIETLVGLHERQARVVELRYFGGLNIEETAEVLGVSVGTVKGDWRLARAWLASRLS